MQEWEHYLIRAKHQIKVYTDHKNLVHLTTTTKELNKRQIRWAEYLSQFDAKILYRKGSENGRADALSWRLDHQQDAPPKTQTMLHQTNDGSLGIGLRQLAATYRTTPQKDLAVQVKRYYQDIPEHEKAQLQEISGALLYKNKRYLPAELRKEVITELHKAPAHGHQGIRAACLRLGRSLDFPNAREKVANILKECDTCNKSRPTRHKPYRLLQPLPTPLTRFDRV